MQLKNTTEGKAWICQFEQGDQKDAVFLLDSLRLVSDNRFHGDVRRAVAKTAEGFGDSIALYAVREVDEGELYFVNKSNRPFAVKPGKVGSEGATSRIITSLERANPKRYMNHPPLRSMKEKKTRHIMLLDDIASSGNRVVEFIQSMRRHKTLVSWCSNHFVQFHLVAYSSPAGFFFSSPLRSKTPKLGLRVGARRTVLIEGSARKRYLIGAES